ncbi:MAG TPA: hypothetical protein DCM05_12480 [Elusimicrobia bacterium]|nr:hypothetical protein [Elusimicrobiota bacterium]
MSPAERLASAARLREDNLRLLEAGIRSREGDLAPEAMRLRVLEHILPQRLFARFYSGSR